MPREYKLYLDDILEAVQHIDDYTRSLSFETFQSDQMRLDAVLYNLIVIGEAVKQVPEDVRLKAPSLEWRKIGGLRDIVAHEYFGVNLPIIWDIIQNKLPDLRRAIAALLEQEP